MSIQEKIFLLEKELSGTKGLKDKVKLLEKIKVDLKGLSNELFYYDFVDCLCLIKKDTLNLHDCIILIRELDKAIVRFQEVDDKKYIKAGSRIKDKAIDKGMEECKERIRNTEICSDIPVFYSLLEESQQRKLLAFFFKERKNTKLIKEECALDLKRHYKLTIYTEIYLFKNTFGDLFNNNELYNIFLGFMNEVFSRIINKRNIKAAKEIREEIYSLVSNDTEDRVFLDILKQNHSGTFQKTETCIEL